MAPGVDVSDGMGENPQRLDEARMRLARAVGRLERSADGAGEGAGEDAGDLAQARAEIAACRETEAELADRLDSAIGRLRAVLGK